jgi:hypothetical protein
LIDTAVASRIVFGMRLAQERAASSGASPARVRGLNSPTLSFPSAERSRVMPLPTRIAFVHRPHVPPGRIAILTALVVCAVASARAVDAAPSLDPAVQELLRASGQRSVALGDLDRASATALSREANGDWVDVVVRGAIDARAVERLGGEVRTVAGPIRTVHLPLAALPALVALAGVEQVQGAQGLELQTNVSIPEIGANIVWGGTPPNYPAPPTGNTGRGVAIGLIDCGIDVNHADLRTSANKTRILWLWDHTPGFPAPHPATPTVLSTPRPTSTPGRIPLPTSSVTGRTCCPSPPETAEAPAMASRPISTSASRPRPT